MNHSPRSRSRADAAGRAPESEGSIDIGLVVAAHGRHCLVESPDGQRRICHPRGKKSQAVVGDRVRWMPTGDEGSIERVEPRINLFYRQDEIRTKSFAANLDQVLVLIAAEPEFSESQLARALIAAEAAGIAPLVALNKSDLVEPFERAWARLVPYHAMGYGVLPLSLRLSADVDREHLLTHHLPPLMRTAGDVSAEWAMWQSRPYAEVDPARPTPSVS